LHAGGRDGNPDPNTLPPQAVRVRLTDETILTWRCDTAPAYPPLPQSSTKYQAKLRHRQNFSAAVRRADAAGRLIARIDLLNRVEHARLSTGLTAGFLV
jgi:hypothetical protein